MGPLLRDRCRGRGAGPVVVVVLVVPVPRALEGIGGEPEPPARPAPVPARPVHVDAPGIERRERLREHRVVVASHLQGRQPEQPVVLGTPLAEADQGRTRAELDEDVGAGLGDRRHARREPHRVPRVRAPVGGVRPLARLEQTAVEVGGQPQRRRHVLDPPRGPLQFVEDRIHEWRVEGVRDGKPADGDSARLELPRRAVDRFARTGDRHVRRGVDGGDRNGAGVRRDRLGDLILSREHRRHRAAGGQAPHELRAARDQSKSVLETEDPRHARGHVLAHAVPAYVLGADAP